MTGSRWSEFVTGAFDDPSGRIVDIAVTDEQLGDHPCGVVSMRFTAEDLRGDEYVASALLYLPGALAEGDAVGVETWFSCGYQLDAAHVPRHLERGRIVVTSCDPVGEEVFPHHNPLCRGPNTDIVLAHLVLGARFVDPDSVIYGGGSAGGYANLLLSAASFPVPVSVPNVPVVNLVYEGAYGAVNYPRIAANPPAEYPLMGLLMAGFTDMMETGWFRAFGSDLSADGWFDHSPVAHLDRITGPVAACFSTADFLVPIEQVGRDVAAGPLGGLPDGVVMAAGDLTDEPRAAVRLIDALGDRAEVRVVSVPDGAVESRMDQLDLTMSTPQVPLPIPAATIDGRQWLITVVDEGSTVMGIGHTRHGFEPDFDHFVAQALSDGVGIEQLTAAKLDQLIDRWTGREWLAPGFHHLDRPEAEQADVARGLRRYCTRSADHASRFAELYEALPADRQALPPDLVDELAGQGSEPAR